MNKFGSKKRMNINIPSVHSVIYFNVMGLCGKRKKSQFDSFVEPILMNMNCMGGPF